MRLLTPVLLLICVGIFGAEERPIEFKPAVVAGAKAYFAAMPANAEPLLLKSNEETENARAVFEWLTQSILIGGHHIAAKYGFSFRKGAPEDEKVTSYLKYAAKLHGEKPAVILDSKKTYVHVKYLGSACPEFHGIIDPEGPTLILFDHDAGG